MRCRPWGRRRTRSWSRSPWKLSRSSNRHNRKLKRGSKVMKFEVCNLKLKVKWAALVFVLALGSGLTCGGAQGGNSKPATAPAKTVVTNAAPAKSLFIQPTGPAEGKDPFYPHSVYPYLHGDKPVEPTPIKPTTQVADVD